MRRVQVTTALTLEFCKCFLLKLIPVSAFLLCIKTFSRITVKSKFLCCSPTSSNLSTHTNTQARPQTGGEACDTVTLLL